MNKSSHNYLYSLARREGSLASTGPPALEAIHWQGKQEAVWVLRAARHTGTNASSYLGVAF